MSSVQVPAAGFWPSTLTARQAACALSDFVELRVAARGVVWSCQDPASGRTLLWQAAVGDVARCLTPEGFSVRSRVYEYGGGSFAVSGQTLVFVNEADQQLYLQHLDEPEQQPEALTDQPLCRYADMQLAPCGKYLVAVEEKHEPVGVQHRIVSIALDAAKPGTPRVLVAGDDFYSSPRLSPDGCRLLWISWQRPHQPWTQTQLYCARADGRGGWQPALLLAGGQGNASIQQPLFDQQNNVLALSDQGGFWQPWRESGDSLHLMQGIEADHAGAPWQMGGCNFLPVDDRYCLLSWFEQGFGKMGLYDMHANRLVRHYLPEYSRMRHLAVDDAFFYCIASRTEQGAAVVAIDRRSGVETVLAQTTTSMAADQVSRPQALEFATCAGQRTRAFFYPPSNRAFRLQPGERPPLVIFLHGGPTSAAYPVFDARIQFWTQRGFAVADLNYRGSTGFGRAYRQMLAGRWGELDVDDVLALVDELLERDLVDARRVCVRGASAGGYTSLLVLAASDRFAAAASWYGVSDPLALDKVTHKFEGDYLGWLLGSLTEANRASIRQRSPVALVSRMKTPVIFFQGGKDVVVVPEQTRSMVQQLRAQGVAVECHEFPEQGHGFRSAERMAFALQAELEFYRQQFARISEGGSGYSPGGAE